IESRSQRLSRRASGWLSSERPARRTRQTACAPRCMRLGSRLCGESGLASGEGMRVCLDVETFVTEMKKHKISCLPVQDQRWGVVTRVTLPGGGQLGVYQPRHARPKAMPMGRAAPKRTKRTTKKSATLSKPRQKAKGGKRL